MSLEIPVFLVFFTELVMMNLSSRQDLLNFQFEFTNETFHSESRQDPEDAFANVYSNTALNWMMAMIYILGLVSCAGLGYISWFERTGQAGPFRTLLNQLLLTT